MIPFVLLLTFTLPAAAVLEDDDNDDIALSWKVVLHNGRVLNPGSVARENGEWVLTFAAGTMTIAADEVREVKRSGADDAPTKNTLLTKSWTKRVFGLGGASLEARLPKHLRRKASGEPGVVVFVSENEKFSVSFAWTGESRTLWGWALGLEPFAAPRPRGGPVPGQSRYFPAQPRADFRVQLFHRPERQDGRRDPGRQRHPDAPVYHDGLWP